MRFKHSKAFPSAFISEADLQGKECTMTIAGWRYVDPKKDKGAEGRAMDKGLVLMFEGAEKSLNANKTNFNTIKGIHGADPDDWKGKQITLYPTTCRLGANPKTPCIRIRNIDPATGKAPEAW